jgi:integrase
MNTRKKLPTYRYHRARNCAVCTINGKNYYLGQYQAPESVEQYSRLIAAFQRGELDLPKQPNGPTVGALALRYMEHARRYYVKNGRPTNQVGICQQALRHVCSLWASLPVEQFSPLKLQAVISAMVAADLSRNYCNKLLTCIKIAIKWGVAQELVPPSVFHGIQAVSGLRRGRTEARETAPVLPVAADIVEQTLQHSGRIVGAMVRLQELTGMRPGELVQIRPQDITLDLSGCAVFRPGSHKTEHHGRERQVFIGPRGLEILRPFLNRAPEAFCFSPAEATAEHHAKRGSRRQTPRYPSHMERNAKKRKKSAKRPPGERFDVHSYARAIARAARRAFPLPPGLSPEAAREFRSRYYWGPNRLRHNFATAARRVAGLEPVAAALGHSSVSVTQVYAESDLTAARELLRKIG